MDTRDEGGPRFSLRVIREHCGQCIFATEDMGGCEREDCPLWPSRESAEPTEGKADAEAKALLALTRFCETVCWDGERQQVWGCRARDCALWPWRGGARTMPDGTNVPRTQEPAEPPDMTPVERACLAAGQTVERLCPGCGIEPLPPRRRKCDGCRHRARREAWRREKRRQRSAARVSRPTGERPKRT